MLHLLLCQTAKWKTEKKEKVKKIKVKWSRSSCEESKDAKKNEPSMRKDGIKNVNKYI